MGVKIKFLVLFLTLSIRKFRKSINPKKLEPWQKKVAHSNYWPDC